MVFITFYLTFLSGTGNTSNDGSYKPSFLTDQELKHLILEVSSINPTHCLLKINIL